MSNRILLILLICFTSTGILVSQNQKKPVSIIAKVNLLDNLAPLEGVSLFGDNNFKEATFGAELGVFKNLNNYFNVGIPLRLGGAKVYTNGTPDQFDKRTNFTADLVGQLGYFKPDYFFTPYLTAGVGYQLESASSENKHGAAFPVGVGLSVRLVRNLYLQAQSEYRFTTLENREQIVYGAGLVLGLNGKGKEPKPLDTDGDGITDAEDECPMLKGEAALNGCPDADGDMVADKDDDCPAETGLAKFGGCPDTDNDGVMDKEDECPMVPGTIELNGCPAPVVTDSDGDGIPDNIDRCPNSPGTVANNGCPEITVEDREILNLAVDNVEFETSRATLKATSFGTLDQIVLLMNKYPDYSLSINGHTDSVGNSKTNQLLSERRAKSCYDYLTSKGITATRIEYVGYGETQPIADNRFKDGREKNRRVEFNLYLK